MYEIQIVLPGLPKGIPVKVIEGDMTGQSQDMLIGRDVLSRCTMFYNGLENSFTIHFLNV